MGAAPSTRKCPHCNVVMFENEALQHVQSCYTATSKRTNDQYLTEYRGSVTQWTDKMYQFNQPLNSSTSQCISRNNEINQHQTNQSVEMDQGFNSNRSNDANEQNNTKEFVQTNDTLKDNSFDNDKEKNNKNVPVYTQDANNENSPDNKYDQNNTNGSVGENEVLHSAQFNNFN